MSLWTPGGEHKIPDAQPENATQQASTQTANNQASNSQAQNSNASGTQHANTQADTQTQADAQTLDPKTQQELEEQLAAVRQRVLETPVEIMLAQHLVGLYEIAAIHLSVEDADMTAAKVAIDAMSGMVEAVKGQLGDAAEPVESMLHQIRMAYVNASGVTTTDGEA